MYVTRPLSRYLADPAAMAEAPPEGPGSGFLVVVDEAAASTSCCWGLCRVDSREMQHLPFPQNRQLALRQNSGTDSLELCAKSVDVLSEILGQVAGVSGGGRAPDGGKAPTPPYYAMLVPVVGEPLSSHRYYVVQADCRHRGKVSACSKEEDKTACCFGSSCVNDVKPRTFDRGDVYQQVEVQQLSPSGNKVFKAVAVATDGIPPQYLRNKKGWKVNTRARPRYDLITGDAQGVDSALRRRMPDLQSLSIAETSSPAVVVGRWYVPFMFVKADGERRLKDQFRKCTFYEMTMEQSWEQIYSRDREGTAGSKPAAEVAVTATVRRSTARLDGTSVAVAVQEDGGAVWFRPAAAAARTATVGLDMVVWERMMWELERGGWVAPVNGDEEEERIERVERRDNGGGLWHKFGCYLLVERFLLKRMDGSLALTCDFRHTDKIKAKWL